MPWPGVRLGVAEPHDSNGGVDTTNPGSEAVNIYVSYPFGRDYTDGN